MSYNNNFKKDQCWSCEHFCGNRKLKQGIFFGDSVENDTYGICNNKYSKKYNQKVREYDWCSKYNKWGVLQSKIIQNEQSRQNANNNNNSQPVSNNQNYPREENHPASKYSSQDYSRERNQPTSEFPSQNRKQQVNKRLKYLLIFGVVAIAVIAIVFAAVMIWYYSSIFDLIGQLNPGQLKNPLP